MKLNKELVRLAELLRMGVKATRDIARERPDDYDKLIDIADRAEIMATELDQMTGVDTTETTRTFRSLN